VIIKESDLPRFMAEKVLLYHIAEKEVAALQERVFKYAKAMSGKIEQLASEQDETNQIQIQIKKTYGISMIYFPSVGLCAVAYEAKRVDVIELPKLQNSEQRYVSEIPSSIEALFFAPKRMRNFRKNLLQAVRKTGLIESDPLRDSP
jgi:hypothetical protein